MDKRIIDFLRCAFPFLATLFLWRADIPWLNPGGMLTLVPIFFCTFIRPTPWFAPFGILMCFMLDYQTDTLLYWTSVYCLCYAINGFQTIFDLTRADNDGASAFAAFFAICVLVLSMPHLLHFMNVFRALWTICWVCALYVPICMLIKRVAHD